MKGVTAFLFLLHAAVVNTGSHSLWLFLTLIHGQTQFPEFSAVVLLDDLQVLYYDGNMKKLIPRSQTSPTTVQDVLHRGGSNVIDRMYFSMKDQFHQVMSNHTVGDHVFQRITGCVLDNDKPSPLMNWDAYDGIEVSRFVMNNRTVNPLWPQLKWTPQVAEFSKNMIKNFYQPFCIKVLKLYLEKESIVFRKERPRVRLIRKTHSEAGEVKMSCLATGFYPRHINLTMLRDGRPIPDEELIVGDVLPNGDGTYQTRRTLGLSVEELREKRQYSCSVKHLALDNKLDISWGNAQNAVLYCGISEPEEGPDVAVICAVVLVPLMVLILAIAALCCVYKRRHGGSAQSSMAVGYSLANADSSVRTAGRESESEG